MSIRFIAAAGVCSALATIGWFTLDSMADGLPSRGGPRVPVLIELFTSEGCSSCPPADDLLAQLLTEQPVAGADVIVLSEHVDYWNRLGWTDPFSSPQFSARQQAYGRVFGPDRVYTPQAVVDGAWETVGSNRRAIAAAIAHAAASEKARVRLELVDGKDSMIDVVAYVEGLPARVAGRPTLKLAVAEDGLVSHVARGENARRTLRHVGVTRSLTDAAKLTEGVAQEVRAAIRIDPSWARESIRIVGFVEEPRTMKVLGVGQAALVPPVPARAQLSR